MMMRCGSPMAQDALRLHKGGCPTDRRTVWLAQRARTHRRLLLVRSSRRSPAPLRSPRGKASAGYADKTSVSIR